jgi:Kef-type K+ transport system membrane component KefB
VFKVGVGMMPRGEVALIVALVGLQSKVISQPNYAIIVFMTGITTLLAPPIMRHLFKSEELGATDTSKPLAPIQL